MSRERSISICAPSGSCRALAAIMWMTRPQGLAPPSSHIDACGGTTRGLPNRRIVVERTGLADRSGANRQAGTGDRLHFDERSETTTRHTTA
jgi:hypothetical protein